MKFWRWTTLALVALTCIFGALSLFDDTINPDHHGIPTWQIGAMCASAVAMMFAFSRYRKRGGK